MQEKDKEEIKPRLIPMFMFPKNKPRFFRRHPRVYTDVTKIGNEIGSIYKLILHPLQNFKIFNK
jgi:hypothetical protein